MTDYNRIMKEIEMKQQWKDVVWDKDQQVSGQSDMVNSPPHNNHQGIECIDAIYAAWDEGFDYDLQGNIMN